MFVVCFQENRSRPGLRSKVYSKSILPHCFICDEEITGRGVPLLVSHTSYTKTGLPTKIGQLMGEGFMVVVSVEDMLCKRCGALLNHLDKLESDLDIVKRALTGYLKMKYGLLDELGSGRAHIINKSVEETPGIATEDRTSDVEYIISEDSHDSESEPESSHGGSNNRTIEILLDEVPSTPKELPQIPKKEPSQHTSQKLYKCTTCNFKTSELSLFQPHFLSCSELPYKCTICEKRFESHKYVRNHIMEAHLSNWTCHFCNKNFSEEKEFTSHMKTHLGHKISSEKMQVEDSLLASGSEEDASCDSQQNIVGSYECNICDYQCNNKKVFDDHVRKHVVLKLFQCKVCKKRFQDKDSLTYHMQDHKSELCSTELETKSDFLEHQQSNNSIITEIIRETLDKEGEDVGKHSDQQKDDTSKQLPEGEQLGNFMAENEEKNDQECSSDRKNEIEFYTCHVCSLTFVNESLFTEHTKMHKQEESNKEIFAQDPNQLLQIEKVNLYDDSTEHDVNSIDSEGRHQYVEMDESLEDMFEKLHAETEKAVHSTNKKEMLDQNTVTIYKCNTCHDEFINDDELQLHKVTQMHLDNVLESNKVTMLVEDKNTDSVQDSFVECCKAEKSSGDVRIENMSSSVGDATLCVETPVIENSEVQNEEISKQVTVQNSPPQIQHNENAKDGFIDIFDMVREKKLSSNDDAEIDHNLLQNMCESNVKSEHMDIPPTPTLDLLSYIPPDMKNMNDGDLYAAAPTTGQSKKTYVCAMCGYRTPAMFDLRRHFKDHKQKSFQCKICNKVLPSTQKLTSHLRSHEKFRGKMTCPYCYEEFPDKYSLQQHLQEKHQKEKIMYKCSFCNETFNTKKAYKVHEEVHPERFSFKCDECDQPFLKEKQLLDHKDAVHRDPHCRFCGKEIMKAKTLRNHELRHIREKDNFECDICKRVFKTKTGLRHHVAVHTGEYKYCCDYCGRGFMSRMMMEEHRSMHTKEERYICDVCGRKFSFQSTYWIHRKWHDNPYPYKCSFCGRMFRHSSLLAVHKRKHTGERPYKCPHCPLTFPVGGTLKRHLILHTGVYPFNCESCKRGFTTRHKYATHLAKIHGDFEMLHTKTQQSEFKMVIRDEPKQAVQQPTVWGVTDDSVPDQMNFKLETIAVDDDTSKDPLSEGIACTIVSDDMLVDNIVPTRVVEIVLDETSQAVATVTLAEHANILPDIWYQ
ncbi:hypothetical protein ANN_14766 [Periplaneta americana]|uniref:C2H2-type domain-containing protein n=1 Tax=Periplaneta americana TaxID=6978 RepID=A0ABQ8SYB1_PERAM|nr:hypothetical protein ANN_14766 [Periplaneta americana]